MRIAFVPLVISLLLSSTANAQDARWPRVYTNGGSVLTQYQPQIQTWEGSRSLDARVAFTLVPKGGKEAVGVLYFTAVTDVNMDTHVVLVRDIAITKVHFPALDSAQAVSMERLARSFLPPGHTVNMTLEQLVACTPKEAPTKTVAVNNDPPVIFVSRQPTLLLQVDGIPVTAPTGQSGLTYVVNASWSVFHDEPAKLWLLFDGKGWQQAPEPGGPWTFTKSLPQSIANLSKDPNWTSIKPGIPPPTKPDPKLPQVFYSEKLADLIGFEGEPKWQSIPGTALQFATNTSSDVIQDTKGRQYYFLTSGRWFRSASFGGPWSYASADLPADFRKIPDESPASSILAFVPGTDQAMDAVMIAQLPTTIEVNSAEAAKKVKIQYSGDPQFKPIDGTSLSYAVNTTDKVIKVSDREYYACVSAIWFTATSPNGPWAVATSVPQAIYAIPPTSPVYNVTYVTQVTTPTTVQATYTSGYTGVYVTGSSTTVVIVSGSGYYHPPYYYYPPYGYPVYYPYPVTYGPYAYHPYPYGGMSYHASYNPNTGMYGRSATAYGAYGSATVAQGYNPSTGTYARGASVSSPYGSRSAAQAYNPYTGTAASTRQGSSPNAQWGTTTVAKGGQSAQAAHVTTAQGTTGAVKTGSGDMYATKDGNVYKNTGSGWEQTGGAAPKSTSTASAAASGSTSAATSKSTASTSAAASKSTASTSAASGSGAAKSSASGSATGAAAASGASAGAAGAHTQELNREAQNRQRGNAESQQYQRRSSGTRSGGGGGRR